MIVEESAAFWASFNKEFPNLAQGTVRLQSLVDQIDFLQVGQEDEYEFWELELGQPKVSTWNIFPERYKICGVQIVLSHDLDVYSRQSYDLLGYLGEIGGIVEFFMLFGVLMIGWFNKFNSNSYLVSMLYTQSTDAF